MNYSLTIKGMLSGMMLTMGVFRLFLPHGHYGWILILLGLFYTAMTAMSEAQLRKTKEDGR